ncbi:hypothetical protein [Propionicicella superfundia]|uniref:hypothetical protein n=1 Tax=Propionicicella superfundia TaxID=348582 RepID=UPI00041E98F1|nr:hypothetical protein [Propionicicella superfundia]
MKQTQTQKASWVRPLRTAAVAVTTAALIGSAFTGAAHADDFFQITPHVGTVSSGEIITVAGTGCATQPGDQEYGDGLYREVLLQVSVGDSTPVAYQAIPAADGSWSTEVTVPARYSIFVDVYASCVNYSGETGAAYTEIVMGPSANSVTLDKQTVAAGEQFTVEGAGCDVADPHVYVRVDASAGFETSQSARAVSTAVDGDWAVQTSADAWLVGTAYVNVACYSGTYEAGQAAWTYQPVAITVTGTAPKVSVSKTTVRLGESFTVSGDHCTIPDAEVIGSIEAYNAEGWEGFSAQPDANGQWVATLTPSTEWGLSAAGGVELVVLARCSAYSHGGDSQTYRSYPIVVVPYSLSVSSAPSKASVGQVANVQASIAGAGAGQSVSTQFLVNGKWSTSQSRTTDSKGAVSIPLTYGQGSVGTYTYRVVTGSKELTTVSGTYSITRTPTSVKVVSAPGAAKVGQSVSIRATVPGAGSGVKVSTQFLVNGKWSTSQSRTTDSKGAVSIPLTYGQGSVGKHTWRVVASYGGVTVASSSTTITRVPSEVKVVSAPSSAKVGKAVSAKLSLSGIGSGQSVSTQFLVKGKWSTSRSGKTDSKGTVSIPLTYGQGSVGKYTWRAVATVSGVTVTSRSVTITRTR